MKGIRKGAFFMQKRSDNMAVPLIYKATTTPKNPFLPSYYPTFPETKPLAPDLTGRTSVKPTTTQSTPPSNVSTQTAKTNPNAIANMSAPSPQVSQTPSQVVGANRDIASEIAAEFEKDTIDWGKVSQLASERDAKIASLGMQTQSTEDYINQLFANRIGSTAMSSSADTPTDPTPTDPTPSQSSGFDSQAYINQLLEAQRARELAALEAAKIRALTGLDATYGQRKNTLETSKNTYLSNLQNALNSQLGNLESSLSGQQQALDTAKTNYQASLDNALNKAMSNLSSEEAKIAPYYYDARNQVAAASDVGAMNFAQYMAGRGIKGAAAGMPQIYQNAALQGQLGALNRQEAAAKSEIERARTQTQNEYETNIATMMGNYEADMARLNQDYQRQVTRLQNEYESGRGGTLNNYQADLAALEAEYLTNKQGIEQAYQQDILSAQAGISAQGLQAYIDQLNADRLFNLQEAGITGRYGGQPTLQAALAEADLTGYYRDAPTLAGQQFQMNLEDRNRQSWLDTINRFSGGYDAEINRVMNDNDTTNDWQIPYLQAAKQKESQAKAEQRAAQAAAASAAEQQRYKQALDLWKTYGEATADIAAILGVPVGAKTADYNIDSINAANKADSQKISTDDKISAITREFSNGTPEAAYEELIKYASDYIADLGMSSYNQLLNYYKNLAGL